MQYVLYMIQSNDNWPIKFTTTIYYNCMPLSTFEQQTAIANLSHATTQNLLLTITEAYKGSQFRGWKETFVQEKATPRAQNRCFFVISMMYCHKQFLTQYRCYRAANKMFTCKVMAEHLHKNPENLLPFYKYFLSHMAGLKWWKAESPVGRIKYFTHSK